MKPNLAGNRLFWNLVQDRKVILLAVLLLLITLSIFYHSCSDSRALGRLASAKQDRSSQAGVPTRTNDPHVLLEELQKQQPEPSGKRNLFSFHTPPPPPPTEGETAEPEIPQPICGNQICEQGENFENCPSDCQPPPPPEIPLRYIGYMQEREGAVAFLTDGKEVFMGRVNDIIANRYRILKITDESIELGYLNLNQSRTIPFQGNS